MELRDKRPVPDKRTKQTSGRWHMWFTLADWWKHGLFNTPHLSLLHISPSALWQSQQFTLVIFSCLEWIIVFVCFERCGGKASSVYSLCILPWFADPNTLNLKRMSSLHEDTLKSSEPNSPVHPYSRLFTCRIAFSYNNSRHMDASVIFKFQTYLIFYILWNTKIDIFCRMLILLFSTQRKRTVVKKYKWTQ